MSHGDEGPSPDRSAGTDPALSPLILHHITVRKFLLKCRIFTIAAASSWGFDLFSTLFTELLFSNLAFFLLWRRWVAGWGVYDTLHHIVWIYLWCQKTQFVALILITHFDSRIILKCFNVKKDPGTTTQTVSEKCISRCTRLNLGCCLLCFKIKIAINNILNKTITFYNTEHKKRDQLLCWQWRLMSSVLLFRHTTSRSSKKRKAPEKLILAENLFLCCWIFFSRVSPTSSL